MGAIPPETFAEELRRLERDRVASFVAALWAAGGWDTEVDGKVVIAERAGERRRLAVTDPPRRVLDRWRSPAVPDNVDAVVRLGDGERSGATEPPTIDASALRDRLLFGLDPDAANPICATHLGVPARDERWDADPEPEPPNHSRDAVSGRTRSRTMLVATVAVAFLVLVVGPGALLGATPLQLGQTSDDSTSDALEPVPEPTCEREPGEVATTVGGALQPASEGASGLQVLWTFTDPEIREDRHYRSFRGFYAAPQFDPLREADGIVLDGVVRDGDEAEAYVIARTGDGNVPYVFDLVQRERDGQSCWSIRSVAPSG